MDTTLFGLSLPQLCGKVFVDDLVKYSLFAPNRKERPILFLRIAESGPDFWRFCIASTLQAMEWPRQHR